MRIWSIHPKYLDAKGMVALWRESLLAKKVLEGKTKGYLHHPQLVRFKNSQDPTACINLYLHIIYENSLVRGYHFDKSKIREKPDFITLPVTDRQLEYELDHLRRKLKIRDPDAYERLKMVKPAEPHPLFYVIHGEIEEWEIILPKD